MRILLMFFILMCLHNVLKAGQNSDFPFIVGAETHVLMADEDGDLWGVGSNFFGQLGFEDRDSEDYFRRIPGLSARSMVAGTDFSLVCDRNGEVWVFGQNKAGQLGCGDCEEKSLQKNPYLKDIKSLTASVVKGRNMFSLALDKSGDIWFSGTTSMTEFWEINGSIPTNISAGGPLRNIVSIAAGDQFFLALNEMGEVWFAMDPQRRTSTMPCPDITSQLSWPYEEYFSLFQIDVSEEIKAIAAGRDFAFLLDKNNHVWSFGDNQCGQLGLGHRDSVLTPQLIPNLENIQQISAGFGHALALNMEGVAFGFGANYYGQLGLGQEPDKQMCPIKIPIGEEINIVGVVATANGSYIIDDTSNLWVMGNNRGGILGISQTEEGELVTGEEDYFFTPFELEFEEKMRFPISTSRVKAAKKS